MYQSGHLSIHTRPFKYTYESGLIFGPVCMLILVPNKHTYKSGHGERWGAGGAGRAVISWDLGRVSTGKRLWVCFLKNLQHFENILFLYFAETFKNILLWIILIFKLTLWIFIWNYDFSYRWLGVPLSGGTHFQNRDLRVHF